MGFFEELEGNKGTKMGKGEGRTRGLGGRDRGTEKKK